MTREEAKTVSNIAMGADGRCRYCARALSEQLAESFPDHPWIEWWEEAFG